MNLRFLALLLLMGPLALHAVECELAKNPISQTTWENLKVTANKDHELTLVAVGQVPAATRKEITSLIMDEASNFASIAPRAEQMLAANEESLTDHAAILLALNNLLDKSQINYVIVDYPPESVPGWEKMASQLYLDAFMLQVREAPKDVSLDRLILLAVGVPFYLKVVEPHRFEKVALEGMPKIPPAIKAATTAEEKAKPGKSSESAFEKLEDKLSDSPQSLRQARRMRRLIHSNAYANLTKDEIKERVLDRFWRPATPAVREWLEVELNDKTKPRVTKRTVEKPDQSFAESMLAKPGKGIAFLQKDKFDRLKKDFTELCE